MSSYINEYKQLKQRFKSAVSALETAKRNANTAHARDYSKDAEFERISQIEQQLLYLRAQALNALGTMYNGHRVAIQQLSLEDTLKRAYELYNGSIGGSFAGSYNSLVQVVCYTENGLSMLGEELARVQQRVANAAYANQSYADGELINCENNLRALQNSTALRNLLAVTSKENQYFDAPFSSLEASHGAIDVPFGCIVGYINTGIGQGASPELPLYAHLVRFKAMPNGQEAVFRNGMNSYLINAIRFNGVRMLPAAFVDCKSFSQKGLNELCTLSNGSIDAPFGSFPTNIKEANGLIKQIYGLAESEAQRGDAQKRYIVILGWERMAQSPEFEQIINAPQHYSLNLILADGGSTTEQAEKLVEARCPMVVNCRNGHFTVNEGNEREDIRFYRAYMAGGSRLIDTLKKAYKQKEVTYRYFERVNLPITPSYNRRLGDSPDFKLLYGVDKSGAPVVWHTMEPDPGNGYMFAGYLLGASRSGKSTTINCLIASLILNYHPDDAELWLADFKMESFKKYADNLPPHVKYLLMDDSFDAIFGFIDSLYAEYEARKLRFGGKNIRQYRSSHPNETVPYIFAIIDEFSIMATAVAENEEYKNKLVSLLKLTGSYGFRYLFASQSYSGVEARALGAGMNNINQRMCMYCNNKEEMRDLLGGKATDDIELVDALPVHKVLARMEVPRPFSGHFAAKYVDALFMDGADEAKWFSWTKTLGRRISCKDKSPQVFDPSIPMTYSRACADINACVNAASNKPEIKGTPHMCLCIGRPRGMERAFAFTVKDRQNENLLLSVSTHSSAQLCGCASILNGAIRCALAYRYAPEIWLSNDDALWRAYGQNVFYPLMSKGLKLYKSDEVKNRAIQIARSFSNGEALHSMIILTDTFSLLGNSGAASSARQQLKSLLGGGGTQKLTSNGFDFMSGSDNAVRSLLNGGAAKPISNNIPSKQEEPDFAQVLALLVQLAPELGTHFVFVTDSSVRLKNELNISPKLFTHRAAFALREDGEADGDFGYNVNRRLKGRANCFVYSDGLNYKTLEPYML